MVMLKGSKGCYQVQIFVMFLEVSLWSCLHQQRSNFSSSFSLFVKKILPLAPLSLAETEVNTHCCDWLLYRSVYMPYFCSIYCVFWYSRCQVLWYSGYVWASVRSWGKIIETMQPQWLQKSFFLVNCFCLLNCLIFGTIIIFHITKDSACMRVCTDLISNTQTVIHLMP